MHKMTIAIVATAAAALFTTGCMDELDGAEDWDEVVGQADDALEVEANANEKGERAGGKVTDDGTVITWCSAKGYNSPANENQPACSQPGCSITCINSAASCTDAAYCYPANCYCP